ncbi:MAG: 3-hydroxyacyl-CoA dehydrogenase, partial [Actinobacteria bacterium]|nr:3-hydroxyacyl-CoA dehydrogenase [Actinomycetota bacterium]
MAGERIAIVGGGSIGVGWAVVFARAGRETALYEPDPARRANVAADLEHRLERLAAGGLLAEPPPAVAARVRLTETSTDALGAATHVQECAPESLELKRELFRELDSLAPVEA